MRRAIASAEVADEQRGADPTTNMLQERVAELLGHEAALFLPSGTMCNQISFRLHARPGGDELILDRSAHPIIAEAGGPAQNAQLMINALDGEGGIFGGEQLAAAIRPENRYLPRSRVVSVEQTTNMGGGRVWPLERVREVLDVAREHGLRAHMDGARLMNAVVASGTSAADFAGGFDTAWLDFTKGLGAPVGAVLEAADGWRLPPVRHRGRGLPARAGPPRGAPRRGPRERACSGRGPPGARLSRGRAGDEHRDLRGTGRVRRADGRARRRAERYSRRPRSRGDAPRCGPRRHRLRARGRQGPAATLTRRGEGLLFVWKGPCVRA